MSKWSKEDRNNYNKSEVFQELEKATVENIFRANEIMKRSERYADFLKKESGLAQKTQEVKALGETAKQVVPQIRELSKALSGSADDGMVDESWDEEALGSHDRESFLSGEEKEVSDAVLDELVQLKEAAIKEGNKKLAYKIERTIDELLSVEVVCE